ncbi:hypothetical protein EMWEY_00059520 [Eimeria maxima]|uniref:Uncharacterized protein n=1 Tax=Eimeria maxima TaxID=5804 RepID=U6MA94_EIMMA|nr:hypothetical protein EMWEY_00059520 [Eimeria maxima]CDJ59973.1 hypothetical protein EMWEY_00059520 [Eimeria maxima]
MAMRAVFAKPSLTAEDVELLMGEAEMLINYAIHSLGKTNVKQTPSYVFMKLSSLFMLFDNMVRTIKVVGKKMKTGTWWNNFAERFRTNYFFPEGTGSEKTQVLCSLVNRLSSALAIYKRGELPALQEIIDLKKIIITRATKDSQLAHPQWQLWLQDDKEFYGSGDDSNSTDVQMPGSPNTFALERCSDPRLPCPMAALLLNFLINDNVAAMVNSQQLRLEQAMVASFPTAFVEHKKH